MDVIFETAALKTLEVLPKGDRIRIVGAFNQVAAEHPSRLSFVTELQGQSGMWRLRKGDYRATYRITETAIEVVTVGHRKDIYR